MACHSGTVSMFRRPCGFQFAISRRHSRSERIKQTAGPVMIITVEGSVKTAPEKIEQDAVKVHVFDISVTSVALERSEERQETLRTTLRNRWY